MVAWKKMEEFNRNFRYLYIGGNYLLAFAPFALLRYATYARRVAFPGKLNYWKTCRAKRKRRTGWQVVSLG